ncbi:hypothetical protein [Hamadaea tsunoensis]|uniref:hypothetical protein n=1 Tax=Hamadaea tsunoensis TaxID=53368 RepID=UPI000411349D|nr:hypothetical protein [Hamadaea tsunoensis]
MSKHATAGQVSEPDVEIDDTAPIDDLAVGLARAERKQWMTRTTVILGGLVLITAGFIGGVQVQKANGSSTAASTPGANRGTGGRNFEGFGGGNFPGFGGTGTGNGGTGTGASSRNATTGKIKLVDGNTVYVELTDGTVVTVKVSDTTKISSAATISVKDLKAGASVTVQGQEGSDGTIAAGSITATK